MARNNECIEERANSYRVKIAYYEEGKRKFYSCSFSFKKYGSKQKALEYAKKHRDEIKVKIANNLIVKEKNLTLNDVYEGAMRLYKVSFETIRKYDSLYRIWILNGIDKNVLFKDIKFNNIQECLNSMVEDVSSDTIKRCFSLWQRMYRFAINSDIVMKDETYKVEIPKSEMIIKQKNMIVSYEDLMSYVDEFPKHINSKREGILYSSAMLIGYYTGMRPSEIFALSTDCIDFEKQSLYIYQRIGSTSIERNTLAHTKTYTSMRRIPFCNELIDVFKTLISYSINGFLFMKDNMQFMNSSEFGCISSRLTKGKFNLYMCRHTFITNRISEGWDLRVVQDYVGHKSSSMTLSYARSNEEKMFNMINGNNQREIRAIA